MAPRSLSSSFIMAKWKAKWKASSLGAAAFYHFKTQDSREEPTAGGRARGPASDRGESYADVSLEDGSLDLIKCLH